MRWAEVAAGYRMPVSQEEQSILDRAKEGVTEGELDERDQEVARKMVSRGLLRTQRKDKSVVYRPDDASDIWRPLPL